jgi:hypothetical protein
MNPMGDHAARNVQHSAGKGGPLRRAWASAWFVTLVMGSTTMAFQVYHSVHYGKMPWELAWMYGIVPLLIAMAILEIVAEWKAAPWPAKVTAYAVMGAAMFLSASATGAVVLHAAPPHFSLLFGALLDAAELLAAYFIMNGPRAADLAAEAAAKAVAEAQRQAAFDAAVTAERDGRRAAEAERDTALRQAQEAARAAADSAAQASALAMRQAEADGELAELRAMVPALEEARDTAEAVLARAERRAEGAEARAARLARSAGSKGNRSGAAADGGKDRSATATKVPKDVDAQAAALAILAQEPGITGRELGERCGRSERWGQDFKKQLAARAAGTEAVPNDRPGEGPPRPQRLG